MHTENGRRLCIETVNSLRMEKGGKGKNRTIRNKASDIGCERPVIGKGHFHGLMRKEECVETVAGAAAETVGAWFAALRRSGKEWS